MQETNQDIMQDIVKDKKLNPLLQDDEVKDYIDNAIKDYEQEVNSLIDKHPYKDEEICLHKQRLKEHTKENLADDIEKFKHYNQDKKDLDFIHKAKDIAKENKDSKKKHKKAKWWESSKEVDTTNNTKDDIKDKRQFTHNTWDSVLQEKRDQWINAETTKRENDLKRRIKDYLENLQEVKDFLHDLGDCSTLFEGAYDEMKQTLDTKNLGDEAYYQSTRHNANLPKDTEYRGHSSYGNSPQKIDINMIKRFFETIKNNKDLQKILELLGRLQDEEIIQKKIKIKEMQSYSYTQILPTKRYKEDICGVTMGRDLENLLPQELALLEDEDLEILFDLKYIQNRLFCFEKQGYYSLIQEREHEVEIEKEIEEKKQRDKNEGAIIICVDTSGSMYGNPEFIAKAITLFLASKATMQKRDCYLINFSTNISTMDLSGKGGMARLMQFLSLSFNGGTDVAPALKEGVKKMQNENFKKSDLIVISDGGFGNIPNELSNKMQTQRDKGNKFYLLDIDGNSGKKTFFDKHWFYDTRSQHVKEIYSMLKDI